MADQSSCIERLIKLHQPGSYNEYVDASGRPGSGYLEGNAVWLGNYDQCQNTTEGKYCLVESSINTSLIANRDVPMMKWGVCVPTSCSESDVKSNIELLAKGILQVGGMPLNIESSIVHCAQVLDRDLGFYITIFTLFFLVILCFIGTLVDITTSTTAHPTWKKYILCWSVHNNLGKIFRLENPDRRGRSDSLSTIRCLHGMRVINISVIVMGHIFLATYMTGAVANPKNLLQYVSSVWWQPVGNAYFMVYSSLCLSGVVVGYHGVALLDRTRGTFSKVAYVLHRYIRLTPSMAILLMFWLFVKPHIGDGPLWYTMTSDPQCVSYWWTNLLYINNLYPISMEQACNGWTWYLSTDCQLHLLAPFVFITLYRNPKNGLLLAAGLITGSVLLTAVIITVFNIDVNLTKMVIQGDVLGMDKYESMVFGKPYCRVAPYIVGMVTGYMLFAIEKQKKAVTLKRKEFILPQERVTMLWITSLVTMCGCIWFWMLLPILYPMEHHASHIIYAALGPMVWAIGIAWMILACHTGHGGYISKFLEWPGWIPLSRLSFSIYLIHPILIFTIFHSINTAVYVNNITILMYYSAVMFLAVPLSVVLVLLVELPVANLEKLVAGWSYQRTDAEKSS